MKEPHESASQADVTCRRFVGNAALSGGTAAAGASMGVPGQHVCVSPGARVVIVRLSKRFPQGMGWPPVFRQLALKAS